MKVNKQISNTEYTLTDSDTIVSNTDLKGVITYVNDTFIRISGYSREELIGVPHNVVRHPDMPPEAFADLWTSVKAGRPWTGCKNDDYYWVLANVTPLHRNNQLVGYMSVRSKSDREKIEAADAVYRLFREGKAGKTGFLRELGEGLNQLLYTSETGLNDVVRVLGALSRGDLTETVTNNYQGTFGQFKDDSNATVEKLKGIINQIRDATDNINTGAKEIASGNNDLSYRTEQQAASLEQTAASMQELTSTVQANTENAKQASQLAIGTAGIAGQVVSTMDEINEASHKISDIISVIDDIAFQTSILAFNAAVQAAHAGAHGQGFAVVASEVRHLAQCASASAEEIKSIIEGSVEKIKDGCNLAAEAGFTMKEILSAIRGVTGMMSEITTASVEQSAGIEQGQSSHRPNG